jgi:hypothetical protein
MWFAITLRGWNTTKGSMWQRTNAPLDVKKNAAVMISTSSRLSQAALVRVRAARLGSDCSLCQCAHWHFSCAGLCTDLRLLERGGISCFFNVYVYVYLLIWVNPCIQANRQMELGHSTLHEYLVHRNTVRSLGTMGVVTECNTLFKSMLIALEYIQERGAAHRDITPRNLFLMRRPRRPKSSLAESPRSEPSPPSNRSGLIEAELPLCQWLGVDSLDDVVVKVRWALLCICFIFCFVLSRIV